MYSTLKIIYFPCVVYSHTWFTKFNKWTKHFLIKIYLSFYSQKGPWFVISWEIDGETYTQRGDFFLSHIFFQESMGANACSPTESRIIRDDLTLCSVACPWFDSRFSALSKSDHSMVLNMWSPSGYKPVRPDCPDTLSSPCLLITTWQLVKAHGVTRNKLKIHVICYITLAKPL